MKERKTNDEILQMIYDRHDVYCNQKYGEGDLLPYSFHLKGVVAQVLMYFHLVARDINDPRVVIFAAAAHDLFEDARMTYNDFKSLLFEYTDMYKKDIILTCEIVLLCQDLRGRTRKERHSDEFYSELKANKLAVFVKVCDGMANSLYSRYTNSSMYETYKKEFPELYARLYEPTLEPLWDDLREILKE